MKKPFVIDLLDIDLKAGTPDWIKLGQEYKREQLRKQIRAKHRAKHVREKRERQQQRKDAK
jgi:hypothetical protein